MNQANAMPRPKKLAAMTQQIFEKTTTVQAPEENTWEDIEAIRTSFAEYLITYANEINMVIQTINSTRVSTKEVQIAINQGKQDLEYFQNQLETLYAKHKGKTGPVTTAADNMLLHTVFQEYYEMQAKLVAVSKNTLVSLTEYIAIVAQSHANESAKDVDVVTDVELKQKEVQ